ncbi:MAG: HD domain-containing protein, partial [Gemmatimonadetes bacterium]|nr:HD domain-containing protein [Gemmatimonadota bacterium]
LEAAKRLAMLVSYKDAEGSGHVERVGRSSAALAAGLGLPADQVEVMRLAAPLHDIGNLAIPDAILLKEDALSLDELDLIKTHTAIGASLLANSSSRILREAEQIALYHHENWDGTGYKPGLAGETIPISARILRVADTYDSMVQARPFRAPWRTEEAVEFITKQAGRRFDPTVVRVFLQLIESGGLDSG